MPPLPKRSDQRRRVNKVPGLQQAAGAKRVPVPQPDGEWHPIARDWFASLAKSGQSQFYEPSDWQYARVIAHQLSKTLETNRSQAGMMTALLAGMSELLVTEGSRRRLRLELLRQAPVGDPMDAARAEVADLVRIATA